MGGWGCSEVRTLAFEGQGCSRSTSMSPYYACDQARTDLIYISTYKVGERMTQAFVCRNACTTQSDCANLTDVCCEGEVVSNPFRATKGCVPVDKCQTDPGALLGRDAGASDARPDGASAPDGMRDADESSDVADDAPENSAEDAADPL